MIPAKCIHCGKTHLLDVTQEQLDDWRRSGRTIQTALPQLSAADRELLLSGVCGTCFDLLLSDEDL